MNPLNPQRRTTPRAPAGLLRSRRWELSGGRRVAALLLGLGLGWPGAGGGATPLTVAAASSLQGALEAVEVKFKQQGDGATLVFGSSGSLARQMVHGAPYDLFLSANESWVAYLVKKGVIDPKSTEVFAEGKLALVVGPALPPLPEGRPLGRGELELLRAPRVRHIALAHPGHAPYGVAARATLRSTGLWDSLQSKLVLGENVRQVLTFVESGNAEAGLIAESLARAGALSWRTISRRLHPPIRNALGLRSGSRARRVSLRFLEVLYSPAGAAILTRNGLTPLTRHGGLR